MNRALLLLFGISVAGCTQDRTAETLRSLEGSGEVTFVCARVEPRYAPDDEERNDALGLKFTPRDLSDCPDTDPVDSEIRGLFALVTQTTRGEVAVVALSGLRPGVLDIEPTVPGLGFLPVGAQPVDIVSTPGSAATFVGVAEVGREGIFALPTTCIGPRGEGERPRELTTWPACRLPSAPGDMAVLIDPPGEDGVQRTSCDPAAPPDTMVDRPEGACVADLSQEMDPPGRRKVAVALPDRAEIWVIDAQWLLDRAPGSYEACQFEERIALGVDLPAETIAQRPPADLNIVGCVLPGLNHGPPPGPFVARPAGFAMDAANDRLFIADGEAPVIHVVDVSDPCALVERPPLLPVSFLDRNRVVTTKKVAVSPPTPTEAKSFVYAVDEDQGSVMIFDVTPGSADRTPLLRPRSALFPFEAPDRIAFDAPVQDVTFAFHSDVIADPATGASSDSVACDPDPRASPDSPGAQYRPVSDFSSGAGPGELRGVFAFLALDSGGIAVVDVEDLDAPCRRPKVLNTGLEEDFRGCAQDPTGINAFTSDQQLDSRPTVTDEVSCRVVAAHRARSTSFVINSSDFGVRAPSLRSFPRLTSEVGRTLSTDQTEEGRNYPKMLAVNFSPEHPAQIYVGQTLYQRPPDDPLLAPQGVQPLEIDPARAENSSLSLSFAEPRAYVPSEQFAATYEGILVAERPAGRFRYENGTARLIDGGIVFCDRGVHDRGLAREEGIRLGVLEENLDAFERRHADYVTITSDLLDEDDAYWDVGHDGASCGGSAPGAGFITCRAQLGTKRAPTDLRELSIKQATRSELTLEPRNVSPRAHDTINKLLACCFPEAVSYTVRASHEWVVVGGASGFLHNVTTDASGACVPDCNPLRAGFRSRAFEVACNADTCPNNADDGQPVIGRADGHVACIVDDPSTEYKTLGAPNSGCIFSNLTTSFVIYRGLEESQPDMTFTWEVTGGFSPFIVNLAAIEGPATIPQSIVYSPQIRELALVDAATKGLVLVDLRAFTPLSFF